MNRSIAVSTDVYAAIWAARVAGENDESTILSRLLGCVRADEPASPTASDLDVKGGVFDVRNSVKFPEGFEIFRSYKGRDYLATATGGRWVRKDNGKDYATLNQLNASIASGAENVWNGNWKFREASGMIQSIDRLRS